MSRLLLLAFGLAVFTAAFSHTLALMDQASAVLARELPR
jgi:hypothetical protein